MGASDEASTTRQPAHRTLATRTSEPQSPQRDPSQLAAAPTRVHDPERYQIIAEHGRGGLGRVSRAHDKELGRDVAIKELLDRAPISQARFLREALITARLEHPGIVPVHEAGCWPDGSPFYAMKLVAGRPLRDLLAERATVDERVSLLHHVIAVADAIAYAHDRNIIHRDLKPSNVIVGEFGETVVIDWGLAKDLAASDDAIAPAASGSASASSSALARAPASVPTSAPIDDLTETGSVLGTPAYMAPEQQRGEPVDQRADVFAIGAMLWELCSLERMPPSSPRDRHRMLARARIDRDLIAIIDKALDADPERRYRDAGALAADLKAFKSGARISARTYSAYAALAHWTRRRRMLAIAAMAFLALLVGSTIALAVLYRTSERHAEAASAALMDSWIQRGQRELFAGDFARALPFLAQAYRQGDHSVAVRAMLHRALKLAEQPRIRAVAQIVDAAFRNQGREIIVVGSSGDAAIVEVATGRALARFTMPPSPPGTRYRVKVSHDGAMAAIAGSDAIVLWDGAASRAIALGGKHDTKDVRLAFDATDQRIALVDTHEVTLWNTDGTRRWSRTIDGFASTIVVLGDQIAVMAAPRRLAAEYTVWLVSAERALSIGSATEIEAIGGDRFVTVEEHQVTLHDLSGAAQVVYPIVQPSYGAIASDGKTVAFGYNSGAIELVDVATARRVALLTGHTTAVLSMAFSPDGRRLVSLSQDRSARVWDIAMSRELFRYVGIDSAPDRVRFAPGGKRFVAVTLDELVVLPIDDPAAQLDIELNEQLGAAAFAGDGKRIVAVTDHSVGMWDAATGAELERIATNVFDGAHASPDLQLIAIPKDDKPDVEIRELHGGALRATLHSTAMVISAAFDHHGARVATANTDGLVELWTPAGDKLAALRGHTRATNYVEFSPDDRQLLSASSDQTARLWSVAAGAPPSELGRVAHREGLLQARFDPSGRRFATAGVDKRVTLWDTATRTALGTFPHEAQVDAVGLDDELLAGGTSSGVIQLWDIASGREAGRFQQAGYVQAADLSHGRMLTTGLDGRILVWDVSTSVGAPGEVVAFVCGMLHDTDVEARALLDCPTGDGAPTAK